MRFWRDFLGGLLLWAAHFFAVYAIGSILPGRTVASLLVLLVTAAAIAVAVWLLARTLRQRRLAADELARWSGGVTLFGYALAGIAILYQGLPAVVR